LLSNEFFLSQNTPKSMSAMALPQTRLLELTALPQALQLVSRGPLHGRREMEGRTGGRGKGEVGGNSALVVGGR